MWPGICRVEQKDSIADESHEPASATRSSDTHAGIVLSTRSVLITCAPPQARLQNPPRQWWGTPTFSLRTTTRAVGCFGILRTHHASGGCDSDSPCFNPEEKGIMTPNPHSSVLRRGFVLGIAYVAVSATATRASFITFEA